MTSTLESEGAAWGGMLKQLMSLMSPRFAPSKRWHIDTILHVLTTVRWGGQGVGEERAELTALTRPHLPLSRQAPM